MNFLGEAIQGLMSCLFFIILLGLPIAFGLGVLVGWFIWG